MTHNSNHLRTIPAVAGGEVGNEAIRRSAQTARSANAPVTSASAAALAESTDVRSGPCRSTPSTDAHVCHRPPGPGVTTAATRSSITRLETFGSGHVLPASASTRARRRPLGTTRHLKGASDFWESVDAACWRSPSFPSASESAVPSYTSPVGAASGSSRVAISLPGGSRRPRIRALVDPGQPTPTTSDTVTATQIASTARPRSTRRSAVPVGRPVRGSSGGRVPPHGRRPARCRGIGD